MLQKDTHTLPGLKTVILLSYQTQVLYTEIRAKMWSSFVLSLHELLHLQTHYMEYVLA
jgi:hypothetical protein